MTNSYVSRGFLGRRRELAEAGRLPPGQYLTEKWPVLHYGKVPKLDLGTWDLKLTGLVEQPVQLSHAQFKQLPRKTVQADIHCVTRWSLLDSSWEGVPVAELMKLVTLKPEATHVMVHAEHGFTANELERGKKYLLRVGSKNRKFKYLNIEP